MPRDIKVTVESDGIEEVIYIEGVEDMYETMLDNINNRKGDGEMDDDITIAGLVGEVVNRGNIIQHVEDIIHRNYQDIKTDEGTQGDVKEERM